jgi:DNA polymerase-3 subunit delta'
LPENAISKALISYGTAREVAESVSSQANGQLSRALHLMRVEGAPFEDWFVSWVRTAFKAKRNKGSVVELLNWSQQIAGVGRETQKQFLLFSIDLFRQALLIKYGVSELTSYRPKGNFEFSRFSNYVHNGNIHLIISELESAYLHVERNGSAKMIFSDLSLKLTKHIHTPPVLS